MVKLFHHALQLIANGQAISPCFTIDKKLSIYSENLTNDTGHTDIQTYRHTDRRTDRVTTRDAVASKKNVSVINICKVKRKKRRKCTCQNFIHHLFSTISGPKL